MKKSEAGQKSPQLLESRVIVAEKIQVRVNKGIEIRDLSIASHEILNKARRECTKWYDYNVTLLRQLFSDESIVNEIIIGPSISAGVSNPPLDFEIHEFRDVMNRHINRLESILERLELYEEATQGSASAQSKPFSEDVFIVHGHDNEVKQTVARGIEKLGLKTHILDEQPNAGQTIIEKLETYSDVGFAVVLLTPDDVGAKNVDNESLNLQPRARQNVIFELGYFIGKLGRKRVCVLYSGSVELPSDIDGMLRVLLDPKWEVNLAKEMKQVGLPVDMNYL